MMKTNAASLSGMIQTNHRHRLRMASLMFFADAAALLLSILLGTIVFGGSHRANLWETEYILYVLLCLSFFSISKLYPGVGINPAEEIRIVFQYSIFASVFSITFNLLLDPAVFNRLGVLAGIWLSSVFLVLAMRWATRISAVRLGMWKEPVLIVARAGKAMELLRYFRKRLRLGYWPVMVAVAGDIHAYTVFNDEQVIRLQDLPSAVDELHRLGVQSALIDLSCAGEVVSPSNGMPLARILPHLIFLSDLHWLEGASLHLHDFEGLFGVETRKNELNTFDLMLKSSLDLVLSVAGLLVLSPALLLIALLIKLDSPGPVFFRSERIGRFEGRIKIIKFRTMKQDAGQILQTYLQSNPAAMHEWNEIHKLKYDPRITCVGKWLRKFSLDELPQLINIIMGDLSLVGARPILPEEQQHYGAHLDVYTGSKPGLTGLWQVSGRSNTTYDERIHYDTYYIHNWSIWLDIYILLRTIWVVLSKDGAY
jgi:Undecaprenyl-phosphate galactose phosphotransferase WbaP